MNIVIRSPNWIGDCVMSLPAIRALKFYLPNARIFVITKAYLKDFFQGIKEIDEIVSISDGAGFKDFISSAIRLRAYNFERGILFTNSFASALLFQFAGVKESLGYRNELRGMLLKKRIKMDQSNGHQ